MFINKRAVSNASPLLRSLIYSKLSVDHRVHWYGGSHSGTPKRCLYLLAVVRAINLVVRGHGAAPP